MHWVRGQWDGGTLGTSSRASARCVRCACAARPDGSASPPDPSAGQTGRGTRGAVLGDAFIYVKHRPETCLARAVLQFFSSAEMEIA